MPYTLRPSKVFVKDPNSTGYLPQNVITEESTQEQLSQIQSAGTTQVNAVNTQGNAKVAAIEAKGGEVLESIPDDYSALSGEVSDLKGAFDVDIPIVLSDYESTLVNYTLSGTNKPTKQTSSATYNSYKIPRNSTWAKLKLTANDSKTTYIAFVKTQMPNNPASGTDLSSYLATGETGRHEISAGTTETLNIPGDCVEIFLAKTSNNSNMAPSEIGYATGVTVALDGKQDKLTFDTAPTASSTNPVTSGGLHTAFAATDAEIGYIADKMIKEFDGYVAANVRATGTKAGTLSASENHIVNNELIKPDRIYEIESGGKTIQFYNYDEAQAYLGTQTTSKTHYSVGDIESYISSNPTAKYVRVRFGTATEGDQVSLDEESANYYKTLGIYMKVFYNFDEEDPSQADSTEGIPNYYFEEGYLKNKIDTIMTNRDTLMGVNSDSFIFVTDYHINTNTGHTPALVRYIAARTGIEKLFSAGDNGRQSKPTDTAGNITQYNATQESACALDELERQVRYAFSSTGNHEWNRGGANDGCVALTKAGVLGFYMDRYKHSLTGAHMESGSYYVDNIVNKIRYYFLNQSVGCVVLDGGRQWFGHSLESIPSGYAVAVIMHHGYIPSAITDPEYDATRSSQGDSHASSHRIQHILDAFQNHTTYTLTVDNVTESYDYTNTSGSVIGVFCGHYHHGSIYEKWGNRASDTDHIMVFRGSCDTMKASATYNEGGIPWYWVDGQPHTGDDKNDYKVYREKNTITEQCFYVMQIDLENKLLYITPIGGDHDYAASSFGDEPEEESEET